MVRYNVEAEKLIADDHKVSAISVRTSDGGMETLEADAFVISAGCWSNHLVQPLGLELPIYPVKGYSLTVPMKDSERGPNSTIHDDNYKVVATRLGNRLRATGFVELADFNRDIPEARLATIRKSVESRFPGCADLDAAETWTGFRPMTPDGPAIIGRGPRDNLYLNTGHGTFGWTFPPVVPMSCPGSEGEQPAIIWMPSAQEDSRSSLNKSLRKKARGRTDKPSRDRRKHGCFRRAYMDVFTAYPGRAYPFGSFSEAERA